MRIKTIAPALLAQARTRRRNHTFLQGVQDRSLSLGMTAPRTLALLSYRVEAARAGADAALLSTGRAAWTERRFRLQNCAEAAARVALQSDDLDLADWLSASILESGKSLRSVEIRALLAVQSGDRDLAVQHRLRQLKIAPGTLDHDVEQWVDAHRERVRIRAAYLSIANTSDAGDSAHLWSRAVSTTGPESARLGALAAAASLRVNRSDDESQHYRRLFLAARIARAPADLGLIRAKLDDAPGRTHG